jgi:hypothetical protein
LIAIPNRNCLTHLVKQSTCKELNGFGIETSVYHTFHLVPKPLPQDPGGFQGSQLVLYGIVHADSYSLQQTVLGHNPAVFAVAQRIFTAQARICARRRNAAQRVDAVVSHKLHKRIAKVAGQIRIASHHHNRTHFALGELTMVAK